MWITSAIITVTAIEYFSTGVTLATTVFVASKKNNFKIN